LRIVERHGRTLILAGCCAIQIAGALYYWSSFVRTGYLPSPFINDKADTFMDFFHPLFWAGDDSPYTVWGSVYPPVNFLFLKAVRWLLVGNMQFLDAFALREYAQSAWFYLVFAYLVVSAFAFRSDLWQGFTNLERVLAYVLATLSSPMLFALERGNLIVFCLPFLALALAKPDWKRAGAIGMLINIKPYFALFLLMFALIRRLDQLVACALVAGLIFLISGVVLDLQFLTFLENLLQFSQDAVFSGRELLSMPSSISAFAQVLRTHYGQGGNFFFENIDTLMVVDAIEFVKWVACATTMLCLAMARRSLSVEEALAVSTVVITNLGVWVGGYSLILYIVAAPIFLRMRFRWIYVGLVVLILSPLDAITIMTDNIGPQFAYLSGTQLDIIWQLGFGAVFRPVLNFSLMLALTLEMLLMYINLAGTRSHQMIAKPNGVTS
jgi:Glycosyltransferase family 87